MKANDFVVMLLRSPLHRLAGNTALLTVSGRKTGRPIATPVNVVRLDGFLWILSLRTRTWWRNIGQGTPVILRLGGRDWHGSADLVSDEAVIAAQLLEYVRQMPAAAGPLGLRGAHKTPGDKAVAQAARERLFVRVCFSQPAPAQPS